jgi:hypothetical protein
VKPLLALLLFCTNSSVNMRRMAMMKEDGCLLGCRAM